MQIGEKVKRLRIRHGLTQEELGARTDLSKGFISQLERDLASPSIATLIDILEALGTNLRDFFNETTPEKMVFTQDEIFVKEDAESGWEIQWLITDAQKNALEPIMLTLSAGAKTEMDDPHPGEEFGHVLSGSVVLVVGERRSRVRKGDSFYFKTSAPHCIENHGKTPARILWVSTPPSF